MHRHAWLQFSTTYYFKWAYIYQCLQGLCTTVCKAVSAKGKQPPPFVFCSSVTLLQQPSIKSPFRVVLDLFHLRSASLSAYWCRPCSRSISSVQDHPQIPHLPSGKAPGPGRTWTETAIYLLSRTRRSQTGTTAMTAGLHTTSWSITISVINIKYLTISFRVRVWFGVNATEVVPMQLLQI